MGCMCSPYKCLTYVRVFSLDIPYISNLISYIKKTDVAVEKDFIPRYILQKKLKNNLCKLPNKKDKLTLALSFLV